MDTHQALPDTDRQAAPPPRTQPSPPRLITSASAGSHRRIAIAVDLSDESAYAVRWAVQNYLRPGDAVILLHVRPTSVLYGADWGAVDLTVSVAAADDDAANGRPDSHESQRKMEEDFDAFTTTKAQDLAQPLVEAQIPFKIHIVKDHDMKERLCLEVERLGPSAVIMGSRGFGAARSISKSRLGSVSDYCVHHCVCPVVVVRYPDDGADAGPATDNGEGPKSDDVVEKHPVPEDEQEFHDAAEEHKGSDKEHKLWRKANSCVPVAVVAYVIQNSSVVDVLVIAGKSCICCHARRPEVKYGYRLSHEQ